MLGADRAPRLPCHPCHSSRAHGSLVLAAIYLWLHYWTTLERPRRRCMWLVRFVERTSGRFLVIKCVPPCPCRSTTCSS